MSALTSRLKAANAKLRGKESGKSKGTKAYRHYDSSGGLDEKYLKLVAIKLTGFPLALDTLAFILKTIVKKHKENPKIQKKFTEVKTTTALFQNNVAPSEKWGQELLKLAGFQQQGEWYKLPNRIDVGRLWIVLSFLEAEMGEEDDVNTYRFEKAKVTFEQAISKAISDSSGEEAERRAEFALRVPPTPPEGAGGSTKVFVFLGKQLVKRFFNADDMLSDVFMWIGANFSSSIPEKLQEGTYELVNKSSYPGVVLDYNSNIDKTLFLLELSPSAELHVLPKGLLEMEHTLNGMV